MNAISPKSSTVDARFSIWFNCLRSTIIFYAKKIAVIKKMITKIILDVNSCKFVASGIVSAKAAAILLKNAEYTAVALEDINIFSTIPA